MDFGGLRLGLAFLVAVQEMDITQEWLPQGRFKVRKNYHLTAGVNNCGPVIESQRKGPETEEQAQPRTHQTDIGLW